MNIELELIEWPTGSSLTSKVIVMGKDNWQRVISGETLKTMLFAWHQRSFYGNFIEEIRTGEGAALQVRIDWLWDLLFEQTKLIHVEMKLDIELKGVFDRWQKLHKTVEEKLLQPSVEEWLNGGHWFGTDELLVRVLLNRIDGFEQIGKKLAVLEKLTFLERERLLESINEVDLQRIVTDRHGEENHAIASIAHNPRGWVYEIDSPDPVRIGLAKFYTASWEWLNEEQFLVPFDHERMFERDLEDKLSGFGFYLRRDVEMVSGEDVQWRVKALVRPRKPQKSDQDLVKISQWLEWEWTILLNEMDWPREEWSAWLQQPRTWIRTAGHLFVLKDDQLDELAKLLASFLFPAPRTVSDWLKAQLETKEEEKKLWRDVEWRNDFRLDQWIDRLRSPIVSEDAPVPESFHGVLRPYQHAGVAWLWRMRELSLGALLADEMGLGKTIQVIVHLLRLKEFASGKPCLMICPTSVLGNWQKELAKFAPSLVTLVHYGANRYRDEWLIESAAQVDVVLTTYGTAQMDSMLIQEIEWDTIVLDEAQQIKNPFTKQTRAIRQFRHDHAIAMTGTPIENRVIELWSIMDVLNTGYLGHYRAFAKDWRRANEEQMSSLRTWVHPFLLRRRKSDPDVELSLPDKTLIPEYVPLSLEQAAAYEKTVQNCLNRLRETDGMMRRGLVLSALTKLKQICNFVDNTSTDSPKLDRVQELVEVIREQDESVLLFTQFVQTGQLLQQKLRKRFGEPVIFLHGGLTKKQRDKLVNDFQSGTPDAPRIFVLSLRAGGYGLNLTAANHVIHVDRWWNPAVEQQASDRVHRIGQTKNVRVYRMITMGTLEERIDELLEEKEQLAERVLESTGEGWLVDQPIELLEKIFRLDENRATFSNDEPFIKMR